MSTVSLSLLSAAFFYLFAISVLSIALGIQIILLPWLVVDYLALTPIWVGWVQAAVLIPNLLLLLVGGLMADKAKSLPWLVPLLIVNILIHAALAVVIHYHWLSILLLLFYALLLGVTNAFIQPWREYLLKQTNSDPKQHGRLQTMVAKSSLCLSVGQAIGISLSSLMDTLGAEALLYIQAGMVLLAALSFSCLRRALPLSTHQETSGATSTELPIGIIEGIKDIWSSGALRSLIAIVAFNGFFHIGVFIVALPLLVQQVYRGSVDFYSGLQLAFVIGTIVTTLIVVYKGALDSAGRRIIFGLLYGGVILLALSAEPTVVGLFILVFFWGVVVGVSANMGRSVLQSLAPDSSRGRMISIYQLSLFGFAPLGALFAGYTIEIWGVLTLLKISGIASLVAFMATMMTRSLWEIEVSR